jgi:hypothetical protein
MNRVETIGALDKIESFLATELAVRMASYLPSTCPDELREVREAREALRLAKKLRKQFEEGK